MLEGDCSVCSGLPFLAREGANPGCRLQDPSAEVRLSAAVGLSRPSGMQSELQAAIGSRCLFCSGSRIPKLSRAAALALAQGLEDPAVRSFAVEACKDWCCPGLPAGSLVAIMSRPSS